MDFYNDIGLVVASDSIRWAGSSMEEMPTFSLAHNASETSASQRNIVETTQAIEQHLVQLIHTSETAQVGLLQVTQVLGETFLADGCFIGIQNQGQILTQNTRWHPNGSAMLVQHPTAILALLSQPAIARGLVNSDWVAISNIKVPRLTSKREKNQSTIVPLSLPQEELPPIKAVLAIQTTIQGATNGIIVLTRSQPHEWTDLEIQRLRTLASSVAIAISQMQLEQQIQRQTGYQSFMDRLTTIIRSTRELDQIFQFAIEGVLSSLHASRGFILLFKYTDPLFKSRAVDRIPKAKAMVECEYPIACEHPQSSAIPQLPTLTPDSHSGTWLKQSFWVSECDVLQQLLTEQTEPIVVSGRTSPLPHYPMPCVISPGTPIAPIFSLDVMSSSLVMPLENQGTLLGCLIVQQQHHRCWFPEEMAFVKLVAAQVSTAIIQAQTLRQVQSLVDERTAQLQRSLDVQAKLYEKTRQQVDQLRQLNQIMEEFLSTMSHELLTPLTSMTLAIRMLRQANLSPEQRTKYLDILERQCVQETSLINDLLALQKLESGSATMRFQPLDIRYPIRDVAQSFEERWARKNLSLHLDLPERPLQICTDLDSLNRILLELLTNAGKYAIPGSTVTLKLSYQLLPSSSQAVLTLSNLGHGITSEEMPYIFDKFRRGQGVTQQAIPGTGLGLALVKGLVEHLSGAIAVTSIPLEDLWETCFTMTLPQSLTSSSI